MFCFLPSESASVQVDMLGKKVRPNHTRCTVILREIADDTKKEEVEVIFNNDEHFFLWLLHLSLNDK